MVELYRTREQHKEEYIGSSYRVVIEWDYKEQDYGWRWEPDWVLAFHLLNEEDWVGIPWAWLRPSWLSFITDDNDIEGFRKVLKEATPKQIDDIVGEIKKYVDFALDDYTDA